MPRLACSRTLPPLPGMQATTWQLISPSGSKPSARYGHVAAWSDAANGLYLHGGYASSGAGLGRSGRFGTADRRLLGRVVVLQPPGWLWDGARAWKCDEVLSWGLGLEKTTLMASSHQHHTHTIGASSSLWMLQRHQWDTHMTMGATFRINRSVRLRRCWCGSPEQGRTVKKDLWPW